MVSLASACTGQGSASASPSTAASSLPPAAIYAAPTVISTSRPAIRRRMERELGCGELCDLLDQMADEGCLWLLLTGGEPFIRPDFVEIYTHAKKRGFLITLFTNGTALTPRLADHLAAWRPFAIEITLYGHTQETYERVTGVPGSYARCMRGIELLLERDLPLKLKTMVMTLNRHEVGDDGGLCPGIGREFRFDPTLNVRLDGGRQPAQLRLPPQEVVALDLADERRVEGWREFCEKFWARRPAGRSVPVRRGVGHLPRRPLRAAERLHDGPPARLRPAAGDVSRGMARVHAPGAGPAADGETACQHCELMALCGQCPGWGQMEAGDQEEPVAYLCEVAHLRAEALGLNGYQR